MPPREIFQPRPCAGDDGKASWHDGGHSVREQVSYIFEPILRGEHQREMTFLRSLMLYDTTKERHQLEEKLERAEQSERCVRRAMFLMAVLAGLSLAGLGYSAILLEDFPQNQSQLVLRVFCAIGLAAVVSFLTFVAFWRIARGALNDERDGCRRLVTKIVEARLGKPDWNAAGRDAPATAHLLSEEI